MTQEHSHFRLGCMILVLNEKDQVLLGQRKNAFAAGEFGTVSGHMEPGETFLQAAVREICEETGLVVKVNELLLFAVSNYIVPEWTDQYVTFDFMIKIASNSKIRHEANKCEGWNWYNLDKLPSPLHYPAQRTIEQYKEYLKNHQLVIS